MVWVLDAARASLQYLVSLNLRGSGLASLLAPGGVAIWAL